jgi:hypothetical protein
MGYIKATMSNLSKFLTLSLVVLILTSCSNPFDYKKNDWIQVTETGKENYEAVYVDKNRIECDEHGNCIAWVKMIFARDQKIPYTGNKTGQVTGYMLARRVDSSVKYYCNLTKSQIISYQIYNKEDKLIDSKWIKGDIMSPKAGTVQHDIWRYVCLTKK